MIDTIPPASGLILELSNKTLLVRGRKWTVQCGVCNIPVQRYPSQLKANKATYCSYACRDESRRRQVDCECVICGNEYRVKESVSKKKATCSPVCNLEFKRRLSEAGVNSINHHRDEGFGKLKQSDLDAIKSSNGKLADIAAKYGVHPKYVSSIRNGKLEQNKQRRNNINRQARVNIC